MKKTTNGEDRHLKFLHDAGRAFYQSETSLEEILKVTLEYFLDDIALDAVSVYLFDEAANALKCVQARMRDKGIIAGESIIPVTQDEDDVVSMVFLGKKNVAVWDGGLRICLCLMAGDDKIGVLLGDRESSRHKITREQIDKISDYVRDFSHGIKHIKMFQVNLRKMNMLLALSKISEVMVRALDLETVLTIILNSAVEILKFDRAKFYLIDDENKMLRGQMSADIQRIIKPIQDEHYPLKKGVNRMVDSLLKANMSLPESEYFTDELILYVPLSLKKRKIGILVVDNIFSRQPITKEDRENMEILANQAAVTIEKTRLYSRVKELSIRDSLTGLFSHRYFLEKLNEEVKMARHKKEKFSLLIIDIDDFKKVNDLYGHQTGDRIIESLSGILKRKVRIIDTRIRPMDAIGRYGGDEFAVMLTGSSYKTALTVSKRITGEVKAQRIMSNGKRVNFKISIGIALFPEDGRTQKELFTKADRALYWAKQHGKHKICLVKDIGKKNSKEIL